MSRLETSTSVAPSEVGFPSNDPSFLLEAEFGDAPYLRTVHNWNTTIRTFLIALSDYGVCVHDPRWYTDRALPDRSEIQRIKYEELRREIASIVATDPDPARISEAIASGFDAAGINPPQVLHLAGSVTINPWQDIITITGTVASPGAIVLTVWHLMKNANEILDFFMRLTIFRHQRNMRISDLKQMAVQQRCETVNQILSDLDDSDKAVAAAYLLTQALDLDHRFPVSLRELTEAETQARRQRLRQAVLPGDDDDPSQGELTRGNG
ncbi:hypothetical protein [Nocardia asiatica]|uniref:hypothetical protein n=1 Tax=Nocardia asiatica TaxID=209252 RepID=UPI002457A3FA|nr:hypothetical protein [Nocardia asiatica]